MTDHHTTEQDSTTATQMLHKLLGLVDRGLVVRFSSQIENEIAEVVGDGPFRRHEPTGTQHVTITATIQADPNDRLGRGAKSETAAAEPDTGDAHCPCVPDDLEQRITQAIAHTEQRLYGCEPDETDAREYTRDALAAVRPELHRRMSEHAELHAKLEQTQAEADTLWRELRRIALLCGDEQANPDQAVALVQRREEALSQLRADRDSWRQTAEDTAGSEDVAWTEVRRLAAERDDMTAQRDTDLAASIRRAERDEWRDRYHRMHSEMDKAVWHAESWRQKAGERSRTASELADKLNAARAERDHARSRLDESRGIARDLRQRLDQNAVEAVDRARAERDRQAEIAADYRDQRNLGYQLLDMTRADRDERQARIDATRRELRDWRRAPEERCTAAYNALTPEPADNREDESQYAPWYCDCDSPDPCTCPDTAATAAPSRCVCRGCTRGEQSDVAAAQHQGYVHGYRDGRTATAAAADAMQQSLDYAERRAGRYKMAYEQACLDQTQPADAADDGSESGGLVSLADVQAERARQVASEGWTPEHDDQHTHHELVSAALTYLTGCSGLWPWNNTPKFGQRDGIKAGALLLAEMERQSRAKRPADDDSEAESGEPEPPFQPGDWVRHPISETPSQVQDVRLGRGDTWIVRTDHGEEPAPTLEPWQPRQGERVTARQLCGAGVGPHVTGRYQHEPDGPDTVVTDSAAVVPVVHYTLRPAEGGDDA